MNTSKISDYDTLVELESKSRATCTLRTMQEMAVYLRRTTYSCILVLVPICGDVFQREWFADRREMLESRSSLCRGENPKDKCCGKTI